MNSFKITIKQLFFLLLIFVFSLIDLKAQNQKFKDGLKNFQENNYKEAKKNFEDALSDKSNYDETLMMLLKTNSKLTDFEAIIENYRLIFQKSSNPSVYLDLESMNFYSIYNIIEDLNPDLQEKQIELWNEIINSNSISPSVKIKYSSFLNRVYVSQNKEQKYKKLLNSVGTINVWSAVGYFENISESGFDKQFEPIMYSDSNYKFKNHLNSILNWFELKGYEKGEWIYLDNHFRIRNSIIYSQTFCNSPTKQRVQLRVGTSGSLKLWLNDELIISESDETNNDLDTYLAEVNLQGGVNRILIQTGSSIINSNNFALRITDSNGENINNLTFAAFADTYAKNTKAETKILDNPTNLFFENLLKNDNSNFCNRILLAQSYLQNDKVHKSKIILKDLTSSYPENTFLLNMMLELHTRDDNNTMYSMTYEKINQIDSNGVNAISDKISQSIKSGDFQQAEIYLAKLKDLSGESPLYFLKKIGILSAQKDEDYIKVMEKAYKKYPNNISFVSYKILIEKLIKKNTSNTIDLYEEYLENHKNISFEMDLVNLYAEKSKDKAISHLKDLLEINPYDIRLKSALINIYNAYEDYEISLKYHYQIIQSAPFVSAFWENLGDCLVKLNQKTDASIAYKKAISYDPSNYEVRHQMRRIEDKKDYFDYFPKINYEQYSKMQIDSSKYPNDNSLMVFNDFRMVKYAEGGNESKTYTMVKILKKAGIDDWKQINLYSSASQYHEIEKAEVIKKNGNKIEAEKEEDSESGSISLVFTNLEPGDMIYYAYKTKHYNMGNLLKHLEDNFMFSSSMPYTYRSYSLLTPKDFEINYKMLNSDLKADIKTEDEFKIYTWRMDEQESVEGEAYMPNIYKFGKILHISTIKDWDYISKWYSDISKTKAKSDIETKDVIKEIFPKSKPQSKIEQVKAIYSYIVNNIRYSSVSFRQSGLIPQKAASVINTKLGDCKDVSTLFVALCKEIGIEANLVLVNTNSNGFYFVLPSTDFDHCIARCIIDGQEHYIELTTDMISFGTISNDLLEAQCLNISDDTKNKFDLIQLKPRSDQSNLVRRYTTVSFNDKLDIKINRHNVKYGIEGAYTRKSYRDIGEDTRRKNIEQNLGDEYNNSRLISYSFDKTLNMLEDSVNQFYEFEAKNPFSKFKELYIIKMPWTDYEKPNNALNDSKRIFPISLRYLFGQSETEENLVIKFPTGKKLEEVPANVTISNEFAEYSITYKVENNELKCVRKFKLKSDIVELDKIAKFKEFYETIVSNDSQQIAFK